MHHFGSGICSQSVFTRGAIFTVIVPATTITSAWRGVAAHDRAHAIEIDAARRRGHQLDAAAARRHREDPQAVHQPPLEEHVERRDRDRAGPARESSVL